VVQVSVELSRLLIVAGEATSVTMGAGCFTTTCLDSVVAPPEPVQVSVKLVFEVGVVANAPEVGWVPLHPPEAVQLWASLALQVNVAGWPIDTLLGVNCRLMTGFGAVAALALLTGPDDPVNDSPSPSQAASAVIAANARAQRDRRVARVLWERARSQ
jgi:hypothetical protein